MIEPASGDLLQSPAHALVNPVNCRGVMGKGLAAQFKRRFRNVFEVYAAACERGELEPGVMLWVEAEGQWIVNFPTKRHWRDKSRIEDIDAGLATLVRDVEARAIRSIAIPPLGCGLGGLDWREVKPRIEQAFATHPDVRVLLFEP